MGKQQQNTAMVTYEAESGTVQLTPQIVKQYLCPNGNPSDAEVYMFIQMCKYQQLNPFLREAYLIKYGNQPATLVTGKETFVKRAEMHPQFDGYEIDVVPDKGIPDSATCRVYRKDRNRPTTVTVDYEEYVQLKDGKPNKMWAAKPRTMLRKVALVQALREAFPTTLGGLYAPEETDAEVDTLPSGFVELPPISQTLPPEPPAQRNINTDACRKRFFAWVGEQGEKAGVDGKFACDLAKEIVYRTLHIDSLKKLTPEQWASLTSQGSLASLQPVLAKAIEVKITEPSPDEVVTSKTNIPDMDKSKKE
jgi:phage recombination protein Bet